jgi:ABC-type lipoprotein export system ATPase subunit
MHHYPRQLSGGQEQRVGIARAVVTDPTLILADEPTGDLDARSAEEILELLERLNREFHKTIVMVTHDPHAAERASRALHLDKGSLREGAPLAPGLAAVPVASAAAAGEAAGARPPAGAGPGVTAEVTTGGRS